MSLSLVRRMSCKGVGSRPCPAWWYEPRRAGRPVERCPRCRALHEAQRRRENHEASDYARKLRGDDWHGSPSRSRAEESGSVGGREGMKGEG